MTRYAVIAALALTCLPSCRHAGDDATPRRYAYPRIEAYDSVYRRVAAGPISIEVNSAATVTSPRDGWLDIRYPRYGAIIYLSATHTDDPDAAIANRRQRISLNLGGASAVTHRMSNGDFDCVVIESTDAGTTPVQMLAVSPRGIIVSGTANISGSSTPADSIRPLVEAITRDAVKMMTSIR